jgi:mannose/fructose/N-acetylgalactosamine-specific phosphotransferase system component IID
MTHLTRKELMLVGFRHSLLQITWFEGGMQNIGLSYCMIPALKRLYPEPGALREALERYQAPFNTHPFLAGVIMGGLLHLEERRRPIAEIASFKQNAMSILAALGDPFFRSALPTFVAVTACLAAIFGGIAAGIVTLLLLFNAVHILIRFIGIAVAYREGPNVLKRIAIWLSPTRTLRLKAVSGVGAGLVLAVSALKFGTPEHFLWQGALAAFGSIACAFLLIRWKRVQLYVVPFILVAIILVEVSI